MLVLKGMTENDAMVWDSGVSENKYSKTKQNTVQWKTPDDGQRICPKHVEFLDKIHLGNWCICWVYYKEKAP